jgi:hypothetical protein
MKKNLITRELLLQKQELEIRKVDLTDDLFVYVRQMTGRERDRFEQSIVTVEKDEKGKDVPKRTMEDFRAKLAVNTICDAEGHNILTPEDVETLSVNISAARLERIITIAQELNKISEEDKENLIKNSLPANADASTSDSPLL